MHSRTLDLPEEARKFAEEHKFELKGYRFDAAKEQTRAPRVVRIAVVQNAIIRPTTAPVETQVRKYVYRCVGIFVFDLAPGIS